MSPNSNVGETKSPTRPGGPALLADPLSRSGGEEKRRLAEKAAGPAVFGSPTLVMCHGFK